MIHVEWLQVCIDRWLLLFMYHHHHTVFAIDLKNEPHGAATWGAGNPATDWDKAASQMGKTLLDNHPDFTVSFLSLFFDCIYIQQVSPCMVDVCTYLQGLVFVEGIVYSIIFSGVKDHPVDLGSPERNKR